MSPSLGESCFAAVRVHVYAEPFSFRGLDCGTIHGNIRVVALDASLDISAHVAIPITLAYASSLQPLFFTGIFAAGHRLAFPTQCHGRNPRSNQNPVQNYFTLRRFCPKNDGADGLVYDRSSRIYH